MKAQISIAIDGPSGAGKSTLAKAIAAELNYIYVDTGAIYRTIGCAVKERGIAPRDAEAVGAILPELSITMEYGEDGLQHMFLNGCDVTREIRLPEISMYASDVSAHPAVRAFLLEMQREMARKYHVIMDGRDIGTVVLPDADVKIFLTADAPVRARRRYLELIERGTEKNYEEVLAELIERDYNDSHRPVAPLKQTKSHILVDTSDMTIEQVIAHMGAIVREKCKL